MAAAISHASRVFVPYCAGLTKLATLENSVTESILIAGSKIPKSSLVIHLKAVHAYYNSTGSPIFLDFKSDLSRVVRFPTAGQRERRLWARRCGCHHFTGNWLCTGARFWWCVLWSLLLDRPKQIPNYTVGSKNTTQCPGLETWPVDPESSVLTTGPPTLPLTMRTPVTHTRKELFI